MARMVPHPGFLLNESPDPFGGPQVRFVSEGLGPSLQRPFDPLEVLGIQTRLPARTSGVFEGPLASFGQSPDPSIHRLAVGPNAPSHLGFRQSLREQLRSLDPPPLQRLEVPSHTRWMSHTSNIA